MRFLSVLLGLLGASWVLPAIAATHFAVIDQIDGPRGARNFASIDPVGRRLYVGRTDGILAVDIDNHKVTPLPLGARRVQMVAPVPGSDLVIATLDDSNSAALVNGRTGAVGRAPSTTFGGREIPGFAVLVVGRREAQPRARAAAAGATFKVSQLRISR